MKGKKRYFVLIILIGLFLGFAYYTKDKRKEQIEKQDEQIKEENELREKKSIKLTNVITIDQDKYGQYEYSEGNLLKFKKNKVYFIIDNKGKELYFGVNNPEIYTNTKGTKSYYTAINSLYDSEGNEIYNKLEDGNTIATITDKEIVVNAGEDKYQIIDIESKDIKNVNGYIGNYKGINVYIKNHKYYVYDNGEKEYDELYSRSSNYYANDNDIIYLKSETDELFLDKEKGKITKDDYFKEKLNDKYYLNHDKCPTIKSYADDKNVLDECIFDYDKVNNNFFAFVTEKEELYILRNDKFEKEQGFIRGQVADNTYFASKGNQEKNYYVFYENGDTKELECPSFVGHAGNNVFSCDNLFDGYFIENNKIRDDKYDYISCNFDTEYCIVSNKNKEGLYYMGEKIIEPIYNDIIVENGYVILDLGYTYNIYYIEKDGKALKKSDLNPKIEEEKYEADVDKIVEEYKLDKELVNNNKDLFTKYASIVEKNEGLKDYKKYIYNYFKVIIDRKEYLDEDMFFSALKTLKVEVQDELSVKGAAGIYNNADNAIRLLPLYKNEDYVIYHEFMHFIDYKLNSNEPEKTYLYNGKVVTKDSYSKLTIEEKRKVEFGANMVDKPKVIVEAGAELYRSRYFADSYTLTYENAVGMYYIFEYLLGEDTMSDVFFGNKNLYTELRKYISEDEYEKFYDSSDKITDINGITSTNDFVVTFETFINIYIKAKGNEWYNDNKFCILLSEVFKPEPVRNSKYYNVYEKLYSYKDSELERLTKEIQSKESNPIVIQHFIYENNEILLLSFKDLTNDKEIPKKYKYDVDKKTIEEIK